jgi:hypothetical protein
MLSSLCAEALLGTHVDTEDTPISFTSVLAVRLVPTSGVSRSKVCLFYDNWCVFPRLFVRICQVTVKAQSYLKTCVEDGRACISLNDCGSEPTLDFPC